MNFLQKIWFEVSNIGITADLESFEQVKIKVLNQAVAIIVPLQVFFNLIFISNLDLINTLIGFTILFLLMSFWFLNYYQKFEFARMVLNSLFPLIMVGTGIICGEKTGLQYNLIIFIVAAFFFHTRFLVKAIFVIYDVILFFILMYYWKYFESPFAELVPFIFPYFSFVISVIIIITLIQRFIIEMSSAYDENQVLLKSLEANNEELKSANEALERFAYVASHDLKTPLRTILGFIELLERDYKNDTIERFPLYFKQVKQGATQMNDLIKNTLEYSRIDNLEEEKKSIDLNDIINTIKIAFDTDATTEIHVLSSLPKIFGEENQLLSLFQNLIENGLKYNDKPIKTIVITHKETPNEVQIILKDNGIGIPQKFHNQIFTMFKRLHTNQEYEGTGLGLAICEKIVHKMNGKIFLTSIEGEGTTFHLAFPKKM